MRQPNFPVLLADIRNRPRVWVVTTLSFLGIYAVSLIICTIVGVLLELLVIGVGWALVFGDGSPPGWFNALLVIIWVAVAFVAPAFPSYKVARRTYRRLTA